MSAKGSTAVGVIVSILILAAIGSIGYYQFEVAPNLTGTSTTSVLVVTCPSSQCVNVTMPNGASSPCQAGVAACGFSPLTITVVIGTNNTIVWTNDDPSIHTATDNGVFNTGNLNQGQSAQYTFTVAGTYTYHCVYHAWMVGTVVVKSA